MKQEYIDPLFNNPMQEKKKAIEPIEVNSALVAANELPPRSPTTKKPMTLVEGAYGNKVFKMWVDLDQRLAIPVRENEKSNG